jgi:hypothetical protein
VSWTVHICLVRFARSDRRYAGARAKMAATMARTIFMVSAGDETERGCRMQVSARANALAMQALDEGRHEHAIK